jgi:multidrug efflux system membrane fusion protein
MGVSKQRTTMADIPPLPPPREGPRPRWLVPVIVVVVVAIAAVIAWRVWGGDSEGDKSKGQSADAKGGKGGGKGGKGGRFAGGAGGVQPVQAQAARIGDINIVQTALGTATPLRTVIVKPRVDGQLKAILFTEGQIVKAGDPIAQIDPVPFQVALSQQEGNLARDAAQLNNARLDLQRYQTLLEQDSIAKQQVDQQAALVKQLEGTVKVDQAQVDNAKLQLSYTHIEAPIPGRVGLTQVDPGNMVKGSDANGVAIITQFDPMGVVFTIPQDTLPRVLARLRAGEKPPVEAWDREQKAVLAKGALVTTDNQIDVTTGTVKLKAQFPNPQGQLFPNQFVNVRMVIDTLKGVVLVPTAAVQRGNSGTVVYVVKEDSTVALRQVTTGPSEGLNTAITTGLQAGERVITDGVDRIREGAKVEVTEPGAGLRGGGGAPGKGGGDPAKREEFRKRLESSPSSPGAPPGDEAKKRFENMTPEQREEMKKRFQGMTPEQREEFRKRRQEGRGQAPQ